MLSLEGQQQDLVIYSVLNWQPVLIFQYWCYMTYFRRKETMRAALFWQRCSWYTKYPLIPYRRLLQSSKNYPFSIFYYEIEKRKMKGRYIHGPKTRLYLHLTSLLIAMEKPGYCTGWIVNYDLHGIGYVIYNTIYVYMIYNIYIYVCIGARKIYGHKRIILWSRKWMYVGGKIKEFTTSRSMRFCGWLVVDISMICRYWHFSLLVLYVYEYLSCLLCVLFRQPKTSVILCPLIFTS